MKSTTFLRSFALWLPIYAVAFGWPAVTSGTYDPWRLGAGVGLGVVFAGVRVWLHQDSRTNDPDVRPHYRAEDKLAP